MRQVHGIELSGWGRYPHSHSDAVFPENSSDVIADKSAPTIARGLGRSYGDAALCTDGTVMITERLGRALCFDEETGILRAEAGMTLASVIATYLPQGWFPIVVPGTKYVSLGGCVAADIHGKNHHRDGSFGEHVSNLEIVLADGSLQRASPNESAPIFWATVGGMGLTGIITSVALRLNRVESAYIVVQHKRASNLDASFEILADGNLDDQYTVAWLDCLGRAPGRSILIRGHHASLEELPTKLRSRPFSISRSELALPLDFPAWFLNRATVSAFNELYYRIQGRRSKSSICDYNRFFFPLDRIGNWNRMYGRRGFVQYQCVFPTNEARMGILRILEELKRTGQTSFLSVLKRFGPEGKGLLSFPLEGYTLTLDLPVGGSELFSFLDSLDAIVVKHGGRVYLAKDSRLRPEMFSAMYCRLDEFLRVRSEIDPASRFASDLSRRLQID